MTTFERKLFMFPLILLSFGVCSISLADDSNYYTLFEESFEEDFPPEGWKLNKTVVPFTWRQVDSAVDNTIFPDDFSGDFFVYVGGASGFSYEESLITPKIVLEDWHECGISCYIACEEDTVIHGINFSIDISYNYDQEGFHTWKKVGYFGDGEILCSLDGYNLQWIPIIYPTYNFLKKTFWVRLRYYGFSKFGLGLDSFEVSCNSYGWNPPDDDDNNDDNDDNNDSTDDDDNDDENSTDDSDNTKEEDCNCGLTFHDPAAPLAFFMVLIGIVSLLISKRRFHL